MAQRAGDARQHPRRAHVGVLVERLADREPQSPQGDVVRDVRCADRTEQNGIELSELIRAVCRHHDAVFLVVIRAPVKILEIQLELTVTLSTDLQGLHPSRDNLGTDSISAHGGNPVSSHFLAPCVCGSL